MPNPTKKKNPNIVQLVKGGSFTVQDADRNKALVCKEAFPWLYDLHNDPESCLELDAGEDHDGTFQLLESSVISRKDHGTNTAHELIEEQQIKFLLELFLVGKCQITMDGDIQISSQIDIE